MTAEAQAKSIGPRDHVVQFYRRDEELVESVGAYVVDAIRSGSVAIVVATPAHRSAFEEFVAGPGGVDLVAARADNLLLMLDAEDLMGRFLVDGQPDGPLFEGLVGGLIQAAAVTGRPVRVYGEMVAVLWDAGHVNAAIALESLWNDLGARLAFSLFCAYPTDCVLGHADSDRLGEVCCLHSAVVGDGVPVVAAPAGVTGLRRVFPAVCDGPRAARHFVVETLQDWGAGRELIDDAALVVTELGTNALLHARSSFAVSISQNSGSICISVADEAAVLPTRRLPQPLSFTGRGLHLVSALSSRWGADPQGAGKVVWAELRR